MQHIIQVRKGRHLVNLPKDVICLLTNFFNASGLRRELQIIVYPGRTMRSSKHCRGVEVKRLDQEKKAVVVVRLDNGDRFSCFVSRPEGFMGTEEDFFNVLKETEVKFNTKVEAEVVKPAETPSELISLSKQFEEVEKQSLAVNEEVKVITERLEQACKKQSDLEYEKREIKQRILSLLR